MNILKVILAIGVSILLSAGLVAPVNAAIWYNPETKQFENTDSLNKRADEVAPGIRGGSPVKKQIIDYDTTEKAGTIIVNTAERRLYLVMEDGKALRYGIGVGREGFTWAGTNRITRKAEWPGWTPPPAMRKRVPDLPAFMPGGPDNPLGARALYIGSTLYRVHGTSEPWTIGQAVSSGCIRMTNEDVTDLYERVQVGARIVVKH
jgi:lipoprotein-anchoring transpeptidase ErfK/SrfK